MVPLFWYKSMRQFKRKPLNDEGFTLVEVIAVLIVFGILAAIAISRGMSTQNDLIAQADVIKSHLRFAQLKALQDDRSDSEPWGINFGSGSTSYTLYRNNADAAIHLPSADSSTYSFPSGSGITVTSLPATVNYDSWGSPVNAGGATVTLSKSGSPSIVITVSAQTGHITP